MTRRWGRRGRGLALATGIGVAVAIVAATVGKEILAPAERAAQARAAAATGGEPTRGPRCQISASRPRTARDLAAYL